MSQNQDIHHQDHRTILLEWDTPEFLPARRGKIWFISTGSVLIFLLIYAFLSANLTMAIVFILLAVIFILVEKREPKMVKMIITDMGIQYKDNFYPYHHINSFWLVYHPPYVQALYLKVRTGRTLRLLRVQMNGQKPQTIRELLLKEIPEIEGAQEPTSDLLARALKLY